MLFLCYGDEESVSHLRGLPSQLIFWGVYKLYLYFCIDNFICLKLLASGKIVILLNFELSQIVDFNVLGVFNTGTIT